MACCKDYEKMLKYLDSAFLKDGFLYCEEKEVDKFRFDGMDEGYSRVINPLNGMKEDAIERLLAESGMSEMQELNLFLNGLEVIEL
jgi:hypothetical protein